MCLPGDETHTSGQTAEIPQYQSNCPTFLPSPVIQPLRELDGVVY